MQLCRQDPIQRNTEESFWSCSPSMERRQGKLGTVLYFPRHRWQRLPAKERFPTSDIIHVNSMPSEVPAVGLCLSHDRLHPPVHPSIFSCLYPSIISSPPPLPGRPANISQNLPRELYFLQFLQFVLFLPVLLTSVRPVPSVLPVLNSSRLLGSSRFFSS